MLASLTRQICHKGLILVHCRHNHFVTQRSRVGASLVKRIESEDQEQCLFPIFRNFDVTTEDRIHKFNAHSDQVIKFIKLGGINKMIATQYCHYLAHLTRTSTSEEDVQYYSTRCMDLMSYIFRQDMDLPNPSRNKLLCDMANTTEENCISVCKKVYNQLDSFTSSDFVDLLSACYKFGLWKEAQTILIKGKAFKVISIKLLEPFILGVIEAANKWKQLDENSIERPQMRADILNHIYEILDRCYQDRQQFVTKNKKQFIEALNDLEFRVVVNPQIKTTGRCTNCKTHLPMFDSEHTAILNQRAKEMLHLGAEKGLYLNCSPRDVRAFEVFLRELYEADRKPIELVIDGLNVAYRNSVGVQYIKKQLNENVEYSKRVRTPEGQARVLINFILRGDILNQFKKIVVIGRYHMTKWPGLMEFFKKNKIHFYSSFNHSKDDLFQIYASTLSPKTMLATGDYFRDHLAQLSDEDRVILERWIDTRQVWVDNRTLKPIWPTFYEKIPSVNRDKGCFHIPIIDFNQLLEADEHEPPPHLNNKSLTWICCCSSKSTLDSASN